MSDTEKEKKVTKTTKAKSKAKPVTKAKAPAKAKSDSAEAAPQAKATAAKRVVKKKEEVEKPVARSKVSTEPKAKEESAAQSIPSDISLSDLKEALKNKTKGTTESKPVTYEKKVDSLGRSYATGKRKNAIARVWLKPGSGQVTVNGKTEDVYFKRPVLRMMIHQPFKSADRWGQYDVECTISGGGLSGQAGALRHGISRALVAYEPDLRPGLKKGGYLTRDSRQVERKKYGRPKARRSFQFSKR